MKTLAINKRARFDYEIDKKYLAGMVLEGHEVKSLKNGGGNLKGGYVLFRNNEAYLVGSHIRAYKFATVKDHNPDATRKLLLNKKEIHKLQSAADQEGVAIIATQIVENEQGKVKVEIGIGRGKRQYEKKETKKRRDIEREVRARYKGV